MQSYDFAVFGAGPSGLSVSNYLNRAGKSVLLIDPYKPGDNPPGAPAGMVNPSAGRKANLSWRSESCYNAFRENLEQLSRESGRKDLFSAEGVLRPAITEELAGFYRDSLNKQSWPEGWVSWLDKKEIRDVNPDVGENFGGLFLHCGLTVYVENYLNSFKRWLRDRGVEFLAEHVNYSKRDSEFLLSKEGTPFAKAEKIVVAAGAETLDFPEWSHLKIEQVKGQLVIFKTHKKLEWSHGVSALGYLLRRGERELVAGSTYEHHFEHLEVTEDAYERIFKKLKRIMPEVAFNTEKVGQLAGVRATTPNHLPVIGPHKKIENLFVITGMGSKGLLFSEYLASLLGEYMLDGRKIPGEVGTARMQE